MVHLRGRNSIIFLFASLLNGDQLLTLLHCQDARFRREAKLEWLLPQKVCLWSACIYFRYVSYITWVQAVLATESEKNILSLFQQKMTCNFELWSIFFHILKYFCSFIFPSWTLFWSIIFSFYSLICLSWTSYMKSF